MLGGRGTLAIRDSVLVNLFGRLGNRLADGARKIALYYGGLLRLNDVHRLFRQEFGDLGVGDVGGRGLRAVD